MSTEMECEFLGDEWKVGQSHTVSSPGPEVSLSHTVMTLTSLQGLLVSRLDIVIQACPPTTEIVVNLASTPCMLDRTMSKRTPGIDGFSCAKFSAELAHFQCNLS